MLFVVIVQRGADTVGDDERGTDVSIVQMNKSEVSKNPERLTSKHVHLRSVIVLKTPEVLTGCLPPRSSRRLSLKDNKNTLDKNTSVGQENLVKAPLTFLLSRVAGLHSVCNAATCCKKQTTTFWSKLFSAKNSKIILEGERIQIPY